MDRMFGHSDKGKMMFAFEKCETKTDVDGLFRLLERYTSENFDNADCAMRFANEYARRAYKRISGWR